MTDQLAERMADAAADAIYTYAKATFNHAAGTTGPEDWMDEARVAVAAALRTLAEHLGPQQDGKLRAYGAIEITDVAARVEHPAEETTP